MAVLYWWYKLTPPLSLTFLHPLTHLNDTVMIPSILAFLATSYTPCHAAFSARHALSHACRAHTRALSPAVRSAPRGGSPAPTTCQLPVRALVRPGPAPTAHRHSTTVGNRRYPVRLTGPDRPHSRGNNFCTACNVRAACTLARACELSKTNQLLRIARNAATIAQVTCATNSSETLSSPILLSRFFFSGGSSNSTGNEYGPLYFLMPMSFLRICIRAYGEIFVPMSAIFSLHVLVVLPHGVRVQDLEPIAS